MRHAIAFRKEAVQAIVAQMADGMLKTVGPDTELIINWGSGANGAGEWEEPQDGHLDGSVESCTLDNT